MTTAAANTKPGKRVPKNESSTTKPRTTKSRRTRTTAKLPRYGGHRIGYARVSSRDQDLAVQVDKLQAAACDRLFKEKRSGLDGNRPALKECLRYLRDGDTLVVSRADRLGRSTGHLLKTIEDLKARGVHVEFLDQPELNSGSKYGELMLTILAGIAKFETELRKERQIEGIVKAQERGVQFGRKLQLTDDVVKEIKAMRKDGALIKDIKAATGLSKASVYRALSADRLCLRERGI